MARQAFDGLARMICRANKTLHWTCGGGRYPTLQLGLIKDLSVEFVLVTLFGQRPIQGRSMTGDSRWRFALLLHHWSTDLDVFDD